MEILINKYSETSFSKDLKGKYFLDIYIKISISKNERQL